MNKCLRIKEDNDLVFMAWFTATWLCHHCNIIDSKTVGGSNYITFNVDGSVLNHIAETFIEDTGMKCEVEDGKI